MFVFFLTWEANLNRAGGEIKGSCPWHHSLRAKNRTAEHQRATAAGGFPKPAQFLRRPLPANASHSGSIPCFVCWVFFFFCLIKSGTGWNIKKAQVWMWKFPQTKLVSISIKPGRCGYRDDRKTGSIPPGNERKNPRRERRYLTDEHHVR